MVKNCKIGAMLVLLVLYSSQSISATANNVKCKGCVGSKDLAKNAVDGSKIKKNAVTGDKIKNGSVSVKDLSLELQGEISALGTGLDSKAAIFIDALPPGEFDPRTEGGPIGSIWIDSEELKVYVFMEGPEGGVVWSLLTQAQNQTYAIGDTGPAGGIVFYVTDGGAHGLEAAPDDLTPAPPVFIIAPWGCSDKVIEGAFWSALGTGGQNTAAIVADCNTPGIAARLVDMYNLNGYTDWFLPSLDELNMLYLNKDAVGGFTDQRPYWSSSQRGGGSDVWRQSFSSGVQGSSGKTANDFQIRPVRTF